MTKPTCLYRHYDKDDNLLYVGISLSAYTRLSQHKSNSEWAATAVKMTTEPFNSRVDALEAEKKAIINEKPLFNVVHNHNKTKDQEPDYVRVYMDNVCKLSQLEHGVTNMLLPLVELMSNNNIVDTRNELKEYVAKHSGITAHTLSNRLTRLIELTAIKRIGVGRYMINPFLYDKSGCKNIDGIRKKFISTKSV